jgi:hypothetical protein
LSLEFSQGHGALLVSHEDKKTMIINNDLKKIAFMIVYALMNSIKNKNG